MNDTYEMTRPSGQHGKGFYVKSALLLAVGAISILVGVLGKRVHDKTLKCEAEKEAAVLCDSATTTQKFIDGVAQCVPILSCETGVISKAGVCESNESKSNKESHRIPAVWVVLVLCALILAMLLFVRRFRRKGKQGTVIGDEINETEMSGMIEMSGGRVHMPLSQTPSIPLEAIPLEERDPLANLRTTQVPLSGPPSAQSRSQVPRKAPLTGYLDDSGIDKIKARESERRKPPPPSPPRKPAEKIYRI